MNRQEPVAIVGMAVTLPGAGDLDTYWRNLVEGTDSISEVPQGRWDDETLYDPDGARPDGIYCRRGGFVDDLADFDPTAYGIMPGSVPTTEPDQLIALRTAAAAIADAGGALPDPSRVGVVLGRGGYLTAGMARLDQRVRTSYQLVRTLRELMPDLDAARLEEVRTAFTDALGPTSPEAVIGLVPNFAASRIANRLDLRGPAYTVDAACASSLVAVDQAVAELAAGRCDVMLAGGVHHCHDVTLWSVFAQLRALSPSQRIRPFHKDADGVLMGEGTGVIVLKRLADAQRAGDRIYAVVRGTGVAGDGRAASLVNPDPGGQARAVRLAWEAAGLDPTAPGALGLLEAHGTGTPNGDGAEMATLAEVFGGRGTPDAVIGSVKSMIGHTMPAAGIAGLIKAALAVHRRVLLPTLHCEDPHPALLETRFRPTGAARPWEEGTQARRAAVNAFGFGGINAHVVIEEAPLPAPSGATRRDGLRDSAADLTVTGSAAEGGAVQPGGAPGGEDPVQPSTAAAGSAPEAGASEPAPLARLDGPLLAAVAAAPFGAGPARDGAGAEGLTVLGKAALPAPVAQVTEPDQLLRLAADSPGDLAALLDADDASLRTAGAPGPGTARLSIADPTPKRIALARKAVARGRAWGGRSDVWFAPEPLLGAAGGGRTVFLFPGLEAEFAPQVADVARHFGLPVPDWQDARVGDVAEHGAAVVGVGRLLAAALRRIGVTPDAVAGHSVGEWTAMADGGMYAADEVDAFLADFDPEILRVPGLAFAAFGAPAAQVEAALPRFPGVVLSHDNAPRQSVACGPHDQVEALAEHLRTEGVLGQVLPFESGFHTPMLAPYLGPIEEATARFTLHRATVPVWSGTTAAPFPEDAEGVHELFVRHLLEPVRFRRLTQSLYDAGFRAFVQLGTGQLPALVGDTLDGHDHLAISANSPRHEGMAQLRRTAAGLWANGAEPDFGALAPATAARPAARAATDTPAKGAHVAAGRYAVGDPRRGNVRPAPGNSEAHPVHAVQQAPGSPATAGVDAGHKPPATRAVRLDLRAGPVTLDPATRDRLRVTIRGAAGHGGGTSQLAPLAATIPAAAELDALLGETAATAAALFAAHRTGVPAGPRAAAPARTATLAAPAPTTPAPTPPAPAPVAPPTPAPLHVSVATMPHLRDHCFFAQRPDWPDIADRWPIVPATTIVQLMMDGVAAHGTPVAVHQARFQEWVVAEPATDVDVVTTTQGDRHSVEFGRFARAEIETAPGYAPPPAPWTPDAPETAPTVTARQMYDERWMFHGPLFRGVTSVTALGDRHLRGVITAPPAPGALLDNVGQLLGYWLIATHTDRTVVFPVGIRHATFHGPHPAPGTDLDCHIRITALTETVLEADVQLVHNGTVWAEIRGWQDRRFDSPPETIGARRKPEETTLSTPRPGGWQLVFERWPDPASRDLMMRNQLAGEERAQYAAHPPRGRRQWFLGRIAAKDAVRRHLWDGGEGPVFPAEVRIRNEASGRPRPEGVHGRQLPPLELSLAHCQEAAVALTHPTRPVGIDIEEVTDRPESTYDAVLAPTEKALFASLGAGPLWLTRFWAAKEAAAKAEGMGMQGRPRDFTLVRAGQDWAEVRTATGRTHQIRFTEVGNPPGLPPRTYVVAWTEEQEPQT